MSVYQSSKSSVQIKTQIEPVCRRIKRVYSSIKLACSSSLWLNSSYRTERSTEQRYIAKLFIINNYSGNWRTILLDCVTNESSLAFQGVSCSLLCSRFLGCHATLPPKKRLLTSEQHSFLIVFVFCLRSVEQTNQITVKCEWRKLSREKSGCDRQSIASVLIMAHETPRKN